MGRVSVRLHSSADRSPSCWKPQLGDPPLVLPPFNFRIFLSFLRAFSPWGPLLRQVLLCPLFRVLFFFFFFGDGFDVDWTCA